MRGRNYGIARHVADAVMRRLYAGDWPARVWAPFSPRVAVRRHALPLGLGLRVGFASDLHFGPTTPRALLDEAAERLSEAKPDVLALGGDFVFLDATESIARELEAWVARVPAALKVAVFGNHDLWTDDARLDAALRNGGALPLVNASTRFRDLAIVGVDDPWTGTVDAARALSGVEGPTLGVAHALEALPDLRAHVDVLLCGHTHGGMLALPGEIPLYVPGHIGRHHPYGAHRFGRCTAIVSRGIGGVEIPVRLFAPPDVLVVDL